MVEAVIFDWAGTTVDYGSFSPIYAFEKTFQAYGLKPTMDEIRQPMGMLKIDHIRTMLHMQRLESIWQAKSGRIANEADVNELYALFQVEIFKVLGEYSVMKPYGLETIAKLRQQGIKIGSTTGYTTEMMEVVTKRAQAQGYEPDCWVAPDMVNCKGRPYPYMIFRNLEHLGVSCVQNVVKIGDTVSDIVEGKNAGVKTVGIIEGSSIMGLKQADFESLTEEEKSVKCQAVQKVYEEAGADYTIRHLGELPALVEKIEKGHS